MQNIFCKERRTAETLQGAWDGCGDCEEACLFFQPIAQTVHQSCLFSHLLIDRDMFSFFYRFISMFFFRFSFFSKQLHNSPLELFIASPLDCQIYFDFFVSLYPYMFLSLFSFATYCTNSPSEMFVVKLTDISTESFQVAFTTIMDQMLNKILPD